MADTYQYLADAEKAEVLAEYARQVPTPEQVIHAAELEHYRLAVQAKLRGEVAPAFEAPDVSQVVERAEIIADEQAALPVVEVESAIEEIVP